ncbi:MAG: DHHA1 domain-containing protein, partial [Candidatus Aerophobetes bacterium]|nr:DHHA1 domain-containing protein [Candidatus Aerophobetes bacterium]
MGIHLYDHHPSHPGDIEGNVGICKEVGATVSILTELIRRRKTQITPSEASLFALGIYEDTGSLSFASTTPLDLEMAGFLLSKGASLELISSFLNRGLTEKQTLLFSDFLEKSQTRLINGVEVVVVVTEVNEFVGGLSLPLHKFIDLKNLGVVFALIKTRDKIYLIARSRIPSVNVAEILSAFGGGGHNFAASAMIEKGDLKKIEKQLYRILKERLGPEVMVREIMSAPVITASPQTSVKEAKEIFKKYKIGALPIVKKERLIGLISREKVEHLA